MILGITSTVTKYVTKYYEFISEGLRHNQMYLKSTRECNKRNRSLCFGCSDKPVGANKNFVSNVKKQK